jgi:hypothetical protein
MYLVDQLMMKLSKDQLIVHIMIEFPLHSMKQISIDSKFNFNSRKIREENLTCRMISVTFCSPLGITGIGERIFFEREGILSTSDYSL